MQFSLIPSAKRVCLLIICMVTCFSFDSSHAQLDIINFSTAEEETRYKTLISELRCLVCQNQNLADSNADLAKDLRKKISNMIVAGQSDKQIIKFMVHRYGDFIHYRPPFNWSTLLLWLSPALLIIIGCLSIWRTASRSRDKSKFIDTVKHKQIKELLKQEPKP